MQKRWLIQYCYIKKGLNQKFSIPVDPAMALVTLKLFRNWAKKMNKFIGINNTLLNFKLLIKHGQPKNDKNLINHVWAGLATAPNFTPAKAASRFLIFTIPGSYKSNFAKALERIFYFNYMLIGEKKLI